MTSAYCNGDVRMTDFEWGDGTSRDDVSPYECSETPGPQIIRPLRHKVPGLIHPCHYALYHTLRLVRNDGDVSVQGHCVSGTIHLGGQWVPRLTHGDTSFRDVPSSHRIM